MFQELTPRAVQPRLAPYLWIVGVGLAAYHNAVLAGFVLDDYAYIFAQPGLPAWQGMPGLFIHGHLSGGDLFYRPLSATSLAVDRQLFGTFAAAFHLQNVLWHLAASLAVYELARRLWPSQALAALASGLLFVAHPVHTEAVTGIVGRAELMATCLALSALLLHLASDGGRLARGLAAVCYFLALLSKESALAMPALAVLLASHLGTPWRVALRQSRVYLVPLAFYLALRLHALPEGGLQPTNGYFLLGTRWQGFWTAVDVLGRYALLQVVPHPLSADYSYQALALSPGPLSPRTAVTVTGLAGLATVAFRLRRVFPPLWLACAGFGLVLLPMSNLIVRIGTIMAERLLYLPSVFACLLFGAGLQWLRVRWSPRLPQLLCAAVVLCLTVLTANRNWDWQSPATLWADTVHKVPRSGLAHANFALSLLQKGQHQAAVSELRLAVALDPTRRDFRATLASLERQDRPAP